MRKYTTKKCAMGCEDCIQAWKAGYRDGMFVGREDGKNQVEKDSYERGRADEANTAKNEISALRDELLRVSEESRERNRENLILNSTVYELSEANEYLENELKNSVKVEAVKKELVEVGRKAVQEFASKLKEKIYKSDYVGGYSEIRLCEMINKLLIEYDFLECLDCEAFSGRDCTRNPYIEGCLKEENKK